MKKHHTFYLVVSLIFFAILALTIGYASFGQKLEMGDISAEVRLNKDIRITNLSIHETTNNGVSNYYDYNVKNNEIGVTLENPLSTVTYKVQVTNFGDVKMGLLQINNLPSNLTYEITGYTERTAICDDSSNCTLGAQKEFYLTIKYKDESSFDSNKTKYDLLLEYDFRSFCSIRYAPGGSNGVTYQKEIMQGDTLVVRFTNYENNYLRITMGEMVLTQDVDYTFDSEHVLTIPNVEDDITISRGAISYSNRETSTPTTFGNYSVVNYSEGDGYGWSPDYSGNNGVFEYDSEGGLVLDEDNPIADLPLDLSQVHIGDEYAVNITIKADTSQKGFPDSKYGGSIVSISSGGADYLFWLRLYNHYLNVSSYSSSAALTKEEDYTKQGFTSLNFSKYNNKKVNIQLTAQLGGKSKLFINGQLIRTFDAGDTPIAFKSSTIGDLRPGRGVKFIGTIYEVVIYDCQLLDSEIQNNWLSAKQNYNITT